MRGRIGGMQPLCLLAQIGKDSDGDGIGLGIFVALTAMVLCWYILSAMSKEKKSNSLWKDDNTEMDSSSDPYRGG